MRRMLTLVSTAGLILMTGIGTAQTANDPIATRKALMSSVGAAAGLGGGMMKGEIAYTPAAGKAAIAAMNASAVAFGDYFPEGSDQGDTKAAAAIWSDPDGFMAEINKFAAATGAAMEASGRPGPADIDAFKAAFGPVLATCKSCHEGFRTR